MISAGSRLGPYEIHSRIGAGGMGEVFKAHDPRLSRDVAIKVLPASFAADSERLRRFQQEARAIGALNHPNILGIFELGEYEQQPFIVSELLEGETLGERIESGTLPLRKAIEYSQQIAQGLAAAHDKGIVHRDLKPDNIFVTRDGRVKILDFGLAKLTLASMPVVTAAPTMGAAAAATTPGQVMGTVGYMSPEQVKGIDTDHRSDIFSLGAIMYEAFSGERAFQRDSAVETMSAILKEDPPELESGNKQIPPALDRIVRHCLEKNPQERFQSARDIAFDLGSLSTTSTSTAQAALKTREIRAWALPAAIAVAVIAASAVGFWAGKSHTTELPRFQQLTFRRGSILSARISPDGQTVIYNAAWEGQPIKLYSSRTDSPGDRELNVDGEILSISKSGEMALLLRVKNVSAYARRGVLARMPISGGAPRELMEDVQDASWGPDGEQMAVVRFIESTRSYQLEFPVGKVLYSTGGWISHPKVSADGKYVAFLDHPLSSGDDQGRPAVVDMSGKVKKFGELWSSSQGLVWSPSGKEIWFSAADEGSERSIYAADLSGSIHAVLRVPGDFLIQDLLPDGRLLGIRQEDRREIRGMAPGAKEERDLSWLDWGIVRDLTPDGKFFVFEEEGNGGGKDYSVYMRGTDGSPAVKLTNFGVGQAISSDGKLAMVILNKTPTQLFLVPTGAGDPVRLVNDDRDYWNVRFLPGNEDIVYCAGAPSKASRCYRMNLASRKESPLAPESVRVSTAISPDGKFVLARDRDHSYFWPTDGSWADKPTSQVTPIPGTLGTEYGAPQFLADGQTAVVIKPGFEVPRKLYKYDLRTGAVAYWKSVGPADVTGTASVSPAYISKDGSAYVYYFARIESQLYTVKGLQ